MVIILSVAVLFGCTISNDNSKTTEDEDEIHNSGDQAKDDNSKDQDDEQEIEEDIEDIENEDDEDSKDVPLTETIKIYYPNINDNEVYFQTKEVEFQTNDITRHVLERIYKEEPKDGFQRVFSENTKINSLYLNEDGMVYIDLNTAFIDEMNAGAGYEAMILQSIANTVGQYYNSPKVILTIDNELYESGHIEFSKGEYIEVEHGDQKEIK